jgi:hypothetical protein
MKARWFIAIPALLALSCTSQSRGSALAITKLVLGTATTSSTTPPVTTCSYDPSATEFDFAQIDPASNTGGTMGVVVQNNLTDPTSINPLLRTNTATFHPHQAVVDYEEIGGTTLTQQIVPVAGSIPTGASGAVLVPFFSPITTLTLTGIIRVIFHIEGTLDDGSNVRTGQHEYIFVTCNTAGCNSACL